MAFDFGSLLGQLGNVAVAAQAANQQLSNVNEGTIVLTSQEEGQIEAAIAKIETELVDLRAKTQAKLRGTASNR